MRLGLLLILVLVFAGATPAFTKPQEPPPPPQLPLDQSLFDGLQDPFAVPPAFNPALECDSAYKKGDCDRNQKLQLADLTRLLNAVFIDPEGSSCQLCLGDMNCDRLLSAIDVVWFVRYFFVSGPAPRRCP